MVFSLNIVELALWLSWYEMGIISFTFVTENWVISSPKLLFILKWLIISLNSYLFVQYFGSKSTIIFAYDICISRVFSTGKIDPYTKICDMDLSWLNMPYSYTILELPFSLCKPALCKLHYLMQVQFLLYMLYEHLIFVCILGVLIWSFIGFMPCLSFLNPPKYTYHQRKLCVISVKYLFCQ